MYFASEVFLYDRYKYYSYLVLIRHSSLINGVKIIAQR